MEVKKICSSCGGELTFNRSIGFYECHHCGTIHKPGVDNKPLSIDTVDEFMQTHKYDDAMHVLVKLIDKEPGNPYFFLRSILLKYRMTQLNILLNSSKNNRNTINTIYHDDQWAKLSEMLPESQKDLTGCIIKFCANAIEILDTRSRIEETKKYIYPGSAGGRDETMDPAALSHDDEFYNVYGREPEDPSDMMPVIDRTDSFMRVFDKNAKGKEKSRDGIKIDEWNEEIRNLEKEQQEILSRVKEIEALI